MKNWFKENLTTIIFSLIFIGIFFGFNSFEKRNESYYSYFFLYLGLYTSSSLLPDWIILKQLKVLIVIPGALLMLIGPLIQVFIFIMFAFILPFMIITLLFKYVPEYLFGIDLNYSTKLYLVLISGIIFITLFGEKLMHRVNKNQNYDKPEKRKKSQIELALALVNKERIRYIIYLSFFIYLIIFSTSKLGNFELFDKPNVSQAVFYSFVTYIAFERIIFNLELMKFSPKNFLSKLFNTWEKHDYFNDEKEKSQ